MDESRKLECLNFFLLVCFRAHESHLVARSTSQRIRFKSTAPTDAPAHHSPLSSGPRGDKLIMKVSNIFHLIQYLKTEIKLTKHNYVKKTVNTYITTSVHVTNALRSSNISVS